MATIGTKLRESQCFIVRQCDRIDGHGADDCSVVPKRGAIITRNNGVDACSRKYITEVNVVCAGQRHSLNLSDFTEVGVEITAGLGTTGREHINGLGKFNGVDAHTAN